MKSVVHDLAEERGAHAEEEDAEREGELHGALALADVPGDLGREVGECVDLPHGDGQQKCRDHRANHTLEA